MDTKERGRPPFNISTESKNNVNLKENPMPIMYLNFNRKRIKASGEVPLAF